MLRQVRRFAGSQASVLRRDGSRPVEARSNMDRVDLCHGRLGIAAPQRLGSTLHGTRLHEADRAMSPPAGETTARSSNGLWRARGALVERGTHSNRSMETGNTATSPNGAWRWALRAAGSHCGTSWRRARKGEESTDDEVEARMDGAEPRDGVD